MREAKGMQRGCSFLETPTKILALLRQTWSTAWTRAPLVFPTSGPSQGTPGLEHSTPGPGAFLAQQKGELGHGVLLAAVGAGRISPRARMLTPSPGMFACAAAGAKTRGFGSSVAASAGAWFPPCSLLLGGLSCFS